jgi:antitoxin HigA-1
MPTVRAICETFVRCQGLLIMKKADAAIHPGEILADELAELEVKPTELARQLAVPPNRITQIIKGKRAITGDTALRIGHWFGTNP